MEHEFEDDSLAFARESSRGGIRFRDTGERRRLSEEQLQEYRGILGRLVAHRIMGHAVYKAVVSIVKTILVLGTIIAFYIVFKSEWISFVLGALVVISTVLRFGWLWWHGRGEPVIRIPIDY